MRYSGVFRETLFHGEVLWDQKFYNMQVTENLPLSIVMFR